MSVEHPEAQSDAGKQAEKVAQAKAEKEASRSVRAGESMVSADEAEAQSDTGKQAEKVKQAEAERKDSPKLETKEEDAPKKRGRKAKAD